MILLSLRNRLPSFSLRHRPLSTSSHLANNSLPSSSLPSPDHATLSPQALLSHYSQQRAQPVTYADLKQYGSPPLEEAKLLESGERTRGLLLSGLSRRVSSFVDSLLEVGWERRYEQRREEGEDEHTGRKKLN